MRTKLLLVVMTILVFILVAMLVCGGRERFKLHSHLLSDLRRPKKRSVTVAVGIPCIPIHLAFLPTVLETIRSQTRRPDEILVALSSYDGPDGTPEELENAGWGGWRLVSKCFCNRSRKQNIISAKYQILKL